MTTATLALRHRDPPGFRGLFARLIRWRLVTDYPHAGIVAGATLFHSTLADGVHPKDWPATAGGWLLLPTTVPMEVAMERIGHRVGLPYDWPSLLAFVLPVSVRWSKADYCFEFCWYVLTGERPIGRVTAEQLLALVAQQLAESHRHPQRLLDAALKA
jgi:hypothetical protein